jgi:hypothetical protein
MLWELSIKTGLPHQAFESAEDVLTVLEILEKQNGK